MEFKLRFKMESELEAFRFTNQTLVKKSEDIYFIFIFFDGSPALVSNLDVSLKVSLLLNLPPIIPQPYA